MLFLLLREIATNTRAFSAAPGGFINSENGGGGFHTRRVRSNPRGKQTLNIHKDASRASGGDLCFIPENARTTFSGGKKEEEDLNEVQATRLLFDAKLGVGVNSVAPQPLLINSNSLVRGERRKKEGRFF